MYPKKTLVITITILSLVFTGCSQTNNSADTVYEEIPTETPTTPPQPIGGDKDEHGCIPSAGYQWDEEKQICVRPWEDEANTQIANPASVNCEEQGGELKIVEEENGSIGNCFFDDGSYCEEWAYYRGECREGENIIQN